jgi:histidine ammonia-lyase
VVAIELLTAARAIDMRGAGASSVSTAVIAALRETVPGPGTDRYLAPEIASAVAFVQSGRALAAARSVADVA